MKAINRRLSILLCLLPLAGCGVASRLDHLGRPPSMSGVEPGAVASSAEMAAATPAEARSASLFDARAQSLFSDRRARRVGDILTVRINIADSAQVNNSTSRTRSNNENLGVPNLLGLESKLGKVLPGAVDPANLVTAESGSGSTGTGQTQRRERIDMTVAAVVTSVLPNGNLVIRGKQEVRVNYELRELVIAGIVRPEDISVRNTIEHSQIAEARIAYGGRGHLSDVQQPRLGQQLLDMVLPF